MFLNEDRLKKQDSDAGLSCSHGLTQVYGELMTHERSSILIIDDDPGIIELAAGIFEDRHEVLFATDGKRALEIAQNALPDLIFLDIMMPEMDGFEVCKRLKSDISTRDIPVIFLTGKNCPEDETHGLKIGAVDYISKPINAAILNARADTQLSLNKALKQLAAQNQELIQSAQLREDVSHIIRHDLKSSLSSIISAPRAILMDDNLTEEQRTFLKLMEEAALRMLNMIEMSLTLLKIESKSYELQYEPVDVIKTLQKIIAENEVISKPYNIETILLFNGSDISPSDQIIIMTEEVLFASMLLNLYKNALEASPSQGFIHINIMQGDELVISMENQGEVPESIRDKFFDKYVTAEKKHGTGLGTYSARIIAEAMGGSIHLDTTKPGHTIISITLPVYSETSVIRAG